MVASRLKSYLGACKSKPCVKGKVEEISILGTGPQGHELVRVHLRWFYLAAPDVGTGLLTEDKGTSVLSRVPMASRSLSAFSKNCVFPCLSPQDTEGVVAF